MAKLNMPSPICVRISFQDHALGRLCLYSVKTCEIESRQHRRIDP